MSQLNLPWESKLELQELQYILKYLSPYLVPPAPEPCWVSTSQSLSNSSTCKDLCWTQ